MAANAATYIGNAYLDPDGSLGPFRVLGKFQAGATQEIKRGELLELSGGNWIPLDADQAMAAIIGISDEEVKSGDLAGYRYFVVPREGDMFAFDLDTAGSDAVATAVYWSSSQVVTVTVGTNQLGTIIGQDHYPQPQGHQADDASLDRGTTIRSTSRAVITILKAASYFAALQE